jgi:hypothetical protein
LVAVKPEAHLVDSALNHAPIHATLDCTQYQ